MRIDAEFVDNNRIFKTDFGQVISVSDGGYERGYEAGREDGYIEGYGAGRADITLQEKSTTPIETEQVISPDAGYDGLSKVAVAPIPEQYIIPAGEKSITENGTYDVAVYASVNVNVGGEDIGLQHDSGSVMIASDTDTLTIHHNMGVQPKMCYIWSDPDTTKSIFLTGTALYAAHTEAYLTQGYGYNSSGGTAILAGSNNVVTADATQVTIKVHTAYEFKAGETYHWLVTST